MSQMLKNVSKGSFFLTVESLASVISGLLYSVFVLRWLGPSWFGIFSLALSVVGLASVNQSLGWGAQFSNPLGLTVMIAIMFGFGLSLLGVFEVTLGGDASTKLSEAAGKEGIGGAFMHGFFTTLLGTSCTAPLVGPVIGIAVNEPGPKVFALFAAIATGLSLPYFLLTWQPSWMRFLPNPADARFFAVSVSSSVRRACSQACRKTCERMPRRKKSRNDIRFQHSCGEMPSRQPRSHG